MSQEPQAQPPQNPQPPQSPQWNRDEKDEKGRDMSWTRDEKEEKDEKGRGRGMGDPLSGIVWAAMFIWAGLVLLADNLHLLQDVSFWGTTLSAWSLIFTGAGIILLIEVAIRLIVPAFRRHVTGTFIFAGILLAIGLGGSFGWGVIWPLIFIFIGVSILVGAMGRR